MPDAGPPLRPSVMFTTDQRGGCPNPTAAVGDPQLTQTLNLTSAATVQVTAHMISDASGRRDLSLWVDNGLVSASLGRTEVVDWYDHQLSWVGTFAAGQHTIQLRAGSAAAYGCGGNWGSISTLILQQ